MFCHFWQKFKIAAIFEKGKIFRNFNEITLSRMVKEIETNLFFAIFWQKFENSKWPPFLGRGKFFENCKQRLYSLDTLWVKNSDQIALSRTV